MAQVHSEDHAGFDRAAWDRQQYTIQRIRTDFGFETYLRGLTTLLDSETPRDVTCGDERIVGFRFTLPGCGILQTDAELQRSAKAIRSSGLPLASLRRHHECGAERLSGLAEAEIAARLRIIAKVLGVPLGPDCEMLPIGVRIARSAMVAGDARVNPCAFEGITPFFCSGISATLSQDVATYASLSFAALPGRFTCQDPFVVGIIGRGKKDLRQLRTSISDEPRIAALWRKGVLAIVGAEV